MSLSRAGRPAASRWRHAYVKAVIVAGGVALLLLVLRQPPVAALIDAPWTLSLVAVVLIVAEQWAVPVSRGDDSADQITTSTTFAVALLLMGPASVAAVAQIIAVAIEDVRSGQSLRKAAYNAAQYVLSICAAFLVLLALHQPIATQGLGAEVQLLPALLAGTAFVAVNYLLVAVVIALHSGQPIRRVAADDARFGIVTAAILVALAPLAAHVVQEQPLMLLLLCSPIVAVHRSAKQALRRQQQALHDSLTGLGNRELLRRRGTRMLEDATPGPAVLLLDLDHFKDVNDTLGHAVGDALLVNIAERLSATVGAGGLVARLGGDEFAIAVPTDLTEAERLATALLTELARPAELDDLRLVVQGSIGVAVAPGHGTDVMTLLKHADTALYEAKTERARYAVYRPETDVNTVERLALLTDLRTAIEDGQLFTMFQPKLDVPGGRVSGVEALVRWQHPQRGIVSPDDFIDLAENSGLIGAITTHVLDQSLGALAGWRRLGHDLHIAVNLSARQLSDLALPERVEEALDRHGVPASSLTLEVTETAIMSDPARADVVVRRLRAAGVSIAVDDYGTGQASLSYLKRLHVDELKIDRAFVIDMLRDSSDAIIVRSTIELGHALGLRIVAEGVEDAETLEMLRDLGCDVVQGWHIGRPMSALAVAGLLLEQRHHHVRRPLRAVAAAR
jgi:diguanylate cyclase (GGDEF)-like protein